MRNFRKFDVYNNSIELAKNIYKTTSFWPENEKYWLISQITRAAVSVPSNIAEGSSRKSDKEFSRFMEYALGSAYEIETQFLISKEIDLITEIESKPIQQDIHIIQKQLTSFISRLRKNDSF